MECFKDQVKGDNSENDAEILQNSEQSKARGSIMKNKHITSCRLIRKFTNMQMSLDFTVYASLKIEGILILIYGFNNIGFNNIWI